LPLGRYGRSAMIECLAMVKSTSAFGLVISRISVYFNPFALRMI
jgi:hypothetical protein